jgi:Protein of unknown function (DUF2505)
MKVVFEHMIDAAKKKVVEAFLDEEFYVAKQKSGGAISVESLEYTDLGGGKFKMRNRVSEPSRLPPFLRKSDIDTFTDETLVDSEGGRLTWKVTPQIGADKFFLSGQVEFVEAGDKTRVVYSTTLEIKVPLLGKKAEKMGLASTKEETARQAAFLNEWVSK